MRGQDLFNQIGTGKEHALKVNPNDSRWFRRLVAEANENGDCIINNGNGYYRPDATREDEVKEFEHYMLSELARARAILYKRKSMKEAFERRKLWPEEGCSPKP